MTNVILTSHKGLEFGVKERIFFNSLRKVYSGEVFVFTNCSPTTFFINGAEKYGFKIVPYVSKLHPCVEGLFFKHNE